MSLTPRYVYRNVLIFVFEKVVFALQDHQGPAFLEVLNAKGIDTPALKILLILQVGEKKLIVRNYNQQYVEKLSGQIKENGLLQNEWPGLQISKRYSLKLFTYRPDYVGDSRRLTAGYW